MTCTKKIANRKRRKSENEEKSNTRERSACVRETYCIIYKYLYICRFVYMYTTVGAMRYIEKFGKKKRRGFQKMRGRIRYEERWSAREREILYHIFIHINLYSCTCFCMIL